MITLFYGDCLEEMKKIPDKSIDMIFADPPYHKIACQWDIIIPFDLMWKGLKRIAKDNAAILLFGSEPFSSQLRLSNLSYFKYDYIWYKNTISNFALAKKQPLRNHEVISVFYKKQPTYNPIKEPRDHNEASAKRLKYPYTTLKGNNIHQNGLPKVKYIPEDIELSYPKTIKRFNSIKKRLHPTEKPIPLLEYFIKTFSNELDTILDFCMGSGSTGVACKNLNRNFIGIEKDLEFFNIAQKRILE